MFRILILLFGLILVSGCANERIRSEIVKLEYPSSGVTLQNFAPQKEAINFDQLDKNPGKLNEFLKPFNSDTSYYSGTELKDFGPWKFPSDDHISPFEKDLIINFALRMAEQEAPRSNKSRGKMKPIGYVFWKDNYEPSKFGFSVRYREG